MSENVFDAEEAVRWGVENTTSRNPSGLCDIELGCLDVEVVEFGLMGRLMLLGAVCNEGLVEVEVGSSSASNGEFP